METGECLGKAVRRIIAVPERNINNFPVGGYKLAAGKRKSAFFDIFPDGKSAKHGEPFLKIEW